MMTKTASNATAIAVTVLTLLVQAGPALSAQCATREQVLDLLADEYGETRQGLGIAADSQSVLELFTSAQSGSWSITMTRPDGVTCLIASGAGWEKVVSQLPAKGTML